MHSAAASPPTFSPAETLTEITTLLSPLLTSSLSTKHFTSRWQVIRTNLSSLSSHLSHLSNLSHNSLLDSLLSNVLSTLRLIETLATKCTDDVLTAGKLLTQSDLDIAIGSISKHVDDLDLLVRSGMLQQSSAIVLIEPGIGAGLVELGFYVRDVFARLQIGGIEFKDKAMDSLIQVLKKDEKAGSVVAKEGNVRYLVCLLDYNVDDSLREKVVLAVALLASACEESRKCVFEEGALGPLLRIIESNSVLLSERAVMAVEAITVDPDNAWAVLAYGGVSVLIDVCRYGSIVAQSHALGAITNVALIEEIRICLREEGGVGCIVTLLSSVPAKAANCISVLASVDEDCRDLILQEKGLQALLHLLDELSDLVVLEHVLRAIYSLSSMDTVRLLSLSSSFVIHLSEFIKNGNLVLQHLAVSLLADLSMMSERNKQNIAGCMCYLVKFMETVKPGGLQEVATQSLVLLLTVKSNRKYLIGDDESVMRLVQMLDPKTESVPKKFPVAVISAIMAGGSNGCRKKLVASGACRYLQNLAEMEVAGAKKLLQKLSGNRLKSILSSTWRE
ncbi:hypothetical protein DCAR_0418183 [Daucus carota subsp. sativus]|uniref:DUF7032 domain-containing protein n=1 Tax=Daucus carota subsp. sativus TaxID=79200 RepID=A0A165Z7W7_DAUCS|nr:PREDICTED: uncharacterized protein LOC108219469 [Daucus carota subsp. sativus]WOG98837.1 hypothetical protein DCAR_0418183 [Daucus carota subsp. sativus]